jgi:hypothetical protein
MSTAPGGDAMTSHYDRAVAVEQLKRTEVPRPLAWTLHAADAAELAARGEHCQARTCRKPVVIVTWRWWRSTEVARILLAEHFTCLEHGQQFADRHHVQVEPAAERPRPSAGRLFPGDLLAEFLEQTGPRARLEIMTAQQIGVCAGSGCSCGFPRCLAPVSYLSSIRYATRSGREHQRGRFLCDRHARNFAARHGLSMAAAPPPGGEP